MSTVEVVPAGTKAELERTKEELSHALENVDYNLDDMNHWYLAAVRYRIVLYVSLSINLLCFAVLWGFLLWG